MCLMQYAYDMVVQNRCWNSTQLSTCVYCHAAEAKNCCRGLCRAGQYFRGRTSPPNGLSDPQRHPHCHRWPLRRPPHLEGPAAEPLAGCMANTGIAILACMTKPPESWESTSHVLIMLQTWLQSALQTKNICNCVLEPHAKADCS